MGPDCVFVRSGIPHLPDVKPPLYSNEPLDSIDIPRLSNLTPASYAVESPDSSENGPSGPAYAQQADLLARRETDSAASALGTTVLRNSPRSSSNRLLAEIVNVLRPIATLSYAVPMAAVHRNAGCAPRSLRTVRAAPRLRPSETSRTLRAERTSHQFLISFSRSVVNDQCLTELGNANRRRKDGWLRSC